MISFLQDDWQGFGLIADISLSFEEAVPFPITTVPFP